jgi:hypothetical protein
MKNPGGAVFCMCYGDLPGNPAGVTNSISFEYTSVGICSNGFWQKSSFIL